MVNPLYETVAENIVKSGQHLFAVFPTLQSPGQSFVYTIGNAEHGLPELLIIGHFPPNVCGMALNALGEAMRNAGEAFDEGFVDIDWNYPFKVRKAGPAAKTEYTLQVGRYYENEDYEVLQVMICDKNGKYPGDEGCDPNFDVVQP